MRKNFHIIFTRAHPSRVSHRWNVCDLREKERPLGVHDKQPCVPVRNVASCDLRVLLDDSLVGSNIKHDSVIHWCIGVNVKALLKKNFVKMKTPHPKSTRAVPRT